MNIETVRQTYPDCVTFKFGDGVKLCQELIRLVRAGKKTATCGALRDYESENEPMPIVGRRDIALNWDGTPALVIEVTDVSVQRFCDVNLSFALAEGENDTLGGWQAGHRAFFERNGGFDPQMELVCERFRLVADFAE